MALEGISGVVLFRHFKQSLLVDILLGEHCKTTFSDFVGPCNPEVTLKGVPTFEVAQILSHFSATVIIRSSASSISCHRRHEKATMGIEEVGDKNSHFDHVL